MSKGKNKNTEKEDNIEQLEGLRQLFGTSFSRMIFWLATLLIPTFYLGIQIGKYLSQIEIYNIKLSHQRELFLERQAGKEEAIRESRNSKEQIEFISKILEDGRNKTK